MKKFLYSALVAIAAISMVGCESGSENNNGPEVNDKAFEKYTGYYRKGLVAIVTSTACTQCPHAIEAVKLLQQDEAYKDMPGRCEFIEFHNPNGFFASEAPLLGQYINNVTTDVLNSYGNNGIPLYATEFDNRFRVVGNEGISYDKRAPIIRKHIIQSLNEKKDVAGIKLSSEDKPTEKKLTATISLKPVATAVYFVGAILVEDNIQYMQSGSLTSEEGSRMYNHINVARGAFTSKKSIATNLETLEAGKEYTFTYDLPYDMNGDALRWKLENCRVLVYLMQVPTDNSLMSRYPFRMSLNNTISCKLGSAIDYQMEK